MGDSEATRINSFVIYCQTHKRPIAINHPEFYLQNPQANARNNKDMINKELLKILACPKCKNTVKLNEKGDRLICDRCKLLYEIRNDIPIMLVDEAKKID